MTGLINRMAQRAQGTLRGIEPLVRSHDTATAALQTAAEETVVTTPLQDPPAHKDFPPPFPPARATLRAQEGGSPTASSPKYIEISATEKSRAIASTEDAQAAEEISAHAPSPVASPIEAHAVKRPIQKAVSDPEAVAHGEASSSSPLPTPRGEPELTPFKREPSSARHRSLEPAPVTPLEATTEHTEIHISIGSIELRAPRAEAPRPSAPFKPRISLDDYLRRQSGANS